MSPSRRDLLPSLKWGREPIPGDTASFRLEWQGFQAFGPGYDELIRGMITFGERARIFFLGAGKQKAFELGLV